MKSSIFCGVDAGLVSFICFGGDGDDDAVAL
jgi:hypothetical protein